jgi:TolB-like protein/Tfp pilus assembly protein PilF/predicted Ser/Thr protein kinase
MTSEKNRHVPLSTEVSPRGTEDDPQLSACAQEGSSPDGFPKALTRERRRSANRRAQTEMSPNTVRLVIGQLIGGRYRIERELGEGGMGVVYLATDEQVPGERFALKVLKKELHPDALTLLREEVRKTRKLSHQNIVDVHSVNVDGQRLYVLMECLEGKSLDALLDEEFGRGMPFSRAWPIIEDVAAALGHAHDHNVIHSDLKPANIFVTTAGRTKLLDFGIARVSRGPLLHKRSGPLALTPAYASCEMLEGKEADRRDDIYSFAFLIYEILSGERPFGELTALEARQAGTKIPPLQKLSREQNAALARALAFDRGVRTASVEKLLKGLLTDQKPRVRTNAVLGGAIIAVVAALGLSYWALNRLLIPTRVVVVTQGVPSDAQPTASHATTTVATFSPPPHSIAVLPFVNISGDKEQQYFSDGLTEELLDSLSRINELQVAARTSSFSFQGEHPDILTVARKLNVASVLEGSVRRSGKTIRITAQLDNAVTGFHFWSQTYDRDLGDVLKLQTEIADAVTTALKVTLLGDVAARIELGGTRNPAAFDAYLRGLKASNMVHGADDVEASIAAYAEAIRLDPSYVLARAARSLALIEYAGNYATGPAIRASYDTAQTDARLAITGAPALADGYLALASVQESESLDFTHAAELYQRAESLAPGNAEVARRYGHFAVLMGHTDTGFAAIRHAVQLDPLNPTAHRLLSLALRMARRYEEAIEAGRGALTLDAANPGVLTTVGLAYYALGDYQGARATCEAARPRAHPAGSYHGIQVCLAITYAKLGRRADAEAMLASVQSWYGVRGAYQYAEIYSQWGNTPMALAWLEAAMRLHDSGLAAMKVNSLLDPLRNEPRFQAIQRALNFPP